MNDGGFFERLRNPKAGVTDGTLEKFGTFFACPANWPEDQVPQEAVDFLHVLGLTPLALSVSPGSCEAISPEYREGEGSGAAAGAGAEGVAVSVTATPDAAIGQEIGA